MRIEGLPQTLPETGNLPVTTGRALIRSGSREVAPTLGDNSVPTPQAIENHAAKPQTAREEILNGVDVRALTPRQMADFSLDLYAAGVIPFEEYSALAYQPELHPDYNRTIGALTGEPASPDKKRDFVEIWEDRLSFELRHGARNTRTVVQAERILGVLKQLSNPTEIRT